jgi:peptidyl-prolyl cis-trans isomerase B (cyclophilin B)
MTGLSNLRFIGLSICLLTLAGCAGHPLVAKRSALDGQPEPAKSAVASSHQPKIETRPDAANNGAEESLPANSGNGVKSTAGSASGTASEEAVVLVTTNLGSMVIEVDEKAAPKTAANFEKLALQGFYNQTTFHRVIPGYMIQGGDPNSKGEDHSLYGTGGPGYTIPAEIGLKPVRGTVAMARLPDKVNPKKESSGSQFFVCVVDCDKLEGGYTVFGHVIKGMDVADKIAALKRDDNDCPVERLEMQVSLFPKSKALEKAN